jgi:signal transduction histidine kinase
VRAIINHKRDVTMERQLEDLKANFLAGVSHELRTPLTSIIGFNKLNLKRMARHLAPYLQTAPHKIRLTFRQIMDDMEVMVSESERLGRLVNDILDLSKLEAGRMDLNFTEVDIGQIIQSAIASTSALWREKGLRVHAAESQKTPACWADSDRLIQVLMNLLSNAIKFTDSDDIIVMTSVSRWHVCVSVRDSGPGISPEDQNTIFEKFRQTAAGQKRGGGTGLGLPICRELIQLHRGKLWVDSVPGEGATFSFTILRADRRTEVNQDKESRTSFSGQWVKADLDSLE